MNVVKYPKSSSKDPHERSLAQFITRMKMLHTQGKLPSAHFKVLSSIPGWKWSTPSNKPKTSQKALKVDDWDYVLCEALDWWIETNKKVPCHRAKKRDERTMGIRLEEMRNKSGISPAGKKMLESIENRIKSLCHSKHQQLALEKQPLDNKPS